MRSRRTIIVRLGCWLALLALWMQALVPVAHHPASMSLGQIAFETGGNMCAALGGEPAGPSDKSPPHQQPPCPICQAFHAIGGFTPAVAVALVAAPDYVIAPTPLAATPVLVRRAFSGARARAPPTSA